VILGLPCL